MTERILIVGTGLVGGSIGLALRRGADAHVTGYDADASNAQSARESGALDEVAASVAEGAESADIVVLAPPVGEPVVEDQRRAG